MMVNLDVSGQQILERRQEEEDSPQQLLRQLPFWQYQHYCKHVTTLTFDPIYYTLLPDKPITVHRRRYEYPAAMPYLQCLRKMYKVKPH